MKLINIEEDIPEVFYIFVGQGRNSSSKANYHNYKLTNRIISSGFNSIITDNEKIVDFINGDINYAPYLPTKTTLAVPSSHCLGVVNGYTLEYELERYRYNNFKTFPSRFSCVFAFGDFESCELASKYYNWDLSKVKKFKIHDFCKDGLELLNKATKVCKCNMEIVTYMWNNDLCFLPVAEREKIFEYYWKCKGAVGIKTTDIETGHTITSNSRVLNEYLIEGVLEEILE